MKKYLLLEVLSEEIPALMQEKAEKTYLDIAKKFFDANLYIKYDDIKVFIGARRLTFYVAGLVFNEQQQEDIFIKGPLTGAPDFAIEGFKNKYSNKKGIFDIANIKNSEYHIFRPLDIGLESSLLEILPQILSGYSWPQTMRWGSYNLKWIRPIHNLLCILYNEHENIIIPLEFGHLKAGNLTCGHRLVANGNKYFTVSSFEDYKEKLEENFVILEREERRKKIIDFFIREKVILPNNNYGKLEGQDAINQISKFFDLYPSIMQNLIDEIIGIVEYPQGLIGQIEERFLSLPKEALIASMSEHQRYIYNGLKWNQEFTLQYQAQIENIAKILDIEKNILQIKPDKERKSFFFFTDNIYIDNEQVRNNIIRGNEKVLVARLADAEFLYNSDIKTGIEEMGHKLSSMIFHHKLGSMADKRDRLLAIIDSLKNFLKQETYEDLKLAAKFCKNDLVSKLVSEFPELQGKIGYYYLLKKFPDRKKAAFAIYYLYDISNCQIEEALLLGLIDRFDTVIGLILAEEKFSSSKDPLGIRRYIKEIVAIFALIPEKLGSVELYVINILSVYKKQNHSLIFDELAVKEKILLLFEESHRKYWEKNDFISPIAPNLLINAINQKGFIEYSNIAIINNKIKLCLSSELFKFIEIYKRISNIIKSCQDNYPDIYEQHERYNFINYPNKTKLIDNIINLLVSFGNEDKTINYQEYFKFCLNNFVYLKQNIDMFFAENKIIDENKKELSCFNINLLQNIKNQFNKLIDFEKLIAID